MLSLSSDDLRQALIDLAADATKASNLSTGDARPQPLLLAEALVGVADLRRRLAKMAARLSRLQQRTIPAPGNRAN